MCWFTTNKYFAKQVLVRAAQVKEPDLDVIQFFHGLIIERKRELEVQLTKIRKTVNSVRTQVRN